MGQSPVAAIWPRQANYLLRRCPGQRVSQGCARVDKRRPGQMQPHHFHEQLVAVRGAVEGTGTGTVVGLAFGLQQLLLPNLAFGVELAYPLLLLIGQARRHGTGGHQYRRQIAKAEGPNQQSGNNLVADTQQ